MLPVLPGGVPSVVSPLRDGLLHLWPPTPHHQPSGGAPHIPTLNWAPSNLKIRIDVKWERRDVITRRIILVMKVQTLRSSP